MLGIGLGKASTPDGLLAAKDQGSVESLPQAKLKSTIVAFKFVGFWFVRSFSA
jgi:hypothetical protein